MKMSDGSVSITDKEYLTFCNAVNLEWQFNPLDELRDEKTGKYNPAKLHELLSPDKFVREYKDKSGNNKKKYIYGSNEESYDEKEGLQQMQNSAGILMNYLEECDAGSNEGDFLKEWEVVYAADAYKLIVDELFEKTSKKLGLKTPLEYPSREEVENNKKITYWIDVVVNTVDYGMSIYSGKNTTNSIASYNSKEYVKKEVTTQASH